MSIKVYILDNNRTVCSVTASGLDGERAAAVAAAKLLSDALARSEPSEAERIYKLYPRKVGRPVAMKAIARAIAKAGFADLLNRTAAYAAAVAGKDPQFIPHPATWFNQERYADDPSTWGGTPSPAQGRRNGEFQESISL